MNIGQAIALLLSLVLAAQATDVAANELPITFTQSSKSVSARLTNDKEESPPKVVLEAFGRRWTDGVVANGNTAEFDVPTVRVPTLFRITTTRQAGTVLGELIAYPPGYKLKWEQETGSDRRVEVSKAPRFISADAPDWFVQWAHSVGLPLQPLDSLPSRNAYLADKQHRELLIVGRAAAGRSPSDVVQLMEKHAPNALVLEADWFGKQKPGPVATMPPPIMILPGMLVGPLSTLQDQHWAAPPLFNSSTVPWPGIVNRRAWIQREQLLLLENLCTPEGDLVLSYVPWQRMLGRNETADVLFREIILAAARPQARDLKLNHRIDLIWPPKDEVRQRTRPVLNVATENRPASLQASATADSSPFDSKPPSRNAVRLRVLDLRGPNLSADDMANLRVPRMVSLEEPLLVLGTDPAVDSGRWAGPPPSEKKKKNHPKKWPPGLTWLANDLLPPSPASQIQLMQAITRWGVPLNPISE